MGVRRQAGYHATAINNLVTAFPSDGNLARGRPGAGLDTSTEGGSSVVGGYNSGGGAIDEDALLGNAGGSRGGGGGGGGDVDWDGGIQQGFQDFLAALQSRPLKEHIGHTPVQVLAGGVLGIVVGTSYAFALGDKSLSSVM